MDTSISTPHVKRESYYCMPFVINEMKQREQKDSEYEEYFGENATVIEKPGIYQSMFNHNDSYIHVLLSTNFEELYLIHTGSKQIRLPPFVDAKYESNIEKNDYKLVRNYTLILNLKKRKDTTLIFCERFFPVIGTSFVMLLREFKIDFKNFDSGCCYILELEGPQGDPIIESKRPLHIYFPFEKDAFMRAWSKDQLGELLSNSLPKRFYYPLIEKKNYIPTISVIRTPIKMSPKLYDSPGVPILEIATPQYQNVRDLSEFRLTPERVIVQHDGLLFVKV